MSKSTRRLSLVGALVFCMLGGSSAVAGTIDFANLSGNNLDIFTNYNDVILGFTVTASEGTWYVAQLYGNPVPDIAAGPIFDSASPDTITVSLTGGGTFVFEQLQLSANNGPANYTITGSDGANTVFTQTGSQTGTLDPWTFSTITSSDPTSVITLLTISLSAGGGSNTSYNIDNIVVSAQERPPDPPNPDEIPEPATLGLAGLALAALGLARKLRA
jgi:hypothetical protein